ncbi:diphosphoinositol polyphosphate phosphohydrolase 1 [Vairimorpha necatrix]|uniref:Diphosphoinositol polyphosphate phosphohydrolase 1 n=1 Tax=Vairimorpha necatrix TaxID=6039 RepID=A0AAX4J868_9MICR
MLVYALSKKFGTIPLLEDTVILVDSSKHENRLVLPKGKIKKGESHEEAALRETFEESGLVGTLVKYPRFKYKKTEYFILKVQEIYEKYQEVNKRRRYFIKISEIKNMKNIKEGIKKIINQATQ